MPRIKHYVKIDGQSRHFKEKNTRKERFRTEAAENAEKQKGKKENEYQDQTVTAHGYGHGSSFDVHFRLFTLSE